MINDIFTFDVNEAIRKIKVATNRTDIANQSSENSLKQADKISNISRISSAVAVNPFFSSKDENKITEIKALIRRYARHWGETEENIEEYIKDQLESYSLDDLIKCFTLLNAEIRNLQSHPANVANPANISKNNSH